jgi:hypothetical protein
MCTQYLCHIHSFHSLPVLPSCSPI